MSVRIIDIAKATGVSHTTVSRILNGAKGYHFSEKTLQDVKLAAVSMGYVPNIAARLTQGKSVNYKTIALLNQPLATFAGRRQMSTCAQLIRDAGYVPILFDFSNVATGWLRLEHFSGAICFYPAQEVQIVELMEKTNVNFPVVTTKKQLTQSENVISISRDFRAGRFLALDHLVNEGRRELGFVGHDQDDKWFLDYCAQRKVNGHLFLRSATNPSDSYRLGAQCGDDIAKLKKIDGVLCEDDEFAIGVISSLFEHGIKVPQQCSVFGFDDLPFAAFARPKISSVRTCGDEHSRLVVEQLINLIENRNGATEMLKNNVKLQCELLLRESTL